jgi:hypothetical protein
MTVLLFNIATTFIVASALEGIKLPNDTSKNDPKIFSSSVDGDTRTEYALNVLGIINEIMEENRTIDIRLIIIKLRHLDKILIYSNRFI